MKFNMDKWQEDIINSKVKNPLPILTFPVIQLMGISVKELIGSSETQAQAMKILAERNHSLAAVSMMDLSVEAEAFGSEIRVTDDDVPVVMDTIVKTMEDAEKLSVPDVGAGRTKLYIDALGMAHKFIQDRPVMAGVIGPFSLAGRLMGLTEIMKAGRRNPQLVHAVLEKCTSFIAKYVGAYKEVGANGILMAEPLAGLLSPKMAEELSEPYVKRIVDAVQDEEFHVFYHNCGDNTLLMIDSILRVGARAYHFGNAIEMQKALELAPKDKFCMGNIDPAAFVFGTDEEIYDKTKQLLETCGHENNFILSTGCDIPPIAKWENIDAFYRANEDFYR